MQVVARHAQTWVTTTDDIDDVRRQVGLLNDACGEIGRDPRTVDRLVLVQRVPQSADAFAEVESTYADLGITDVVIPWPRATEPYAGDEALLESISAERNTESSKPGNRRSSSSRRTV